MKRCPWYVVGSWAAGVLFLAWASWATATDPNASREAPFLTGAVALLLLFVGPNGDEWGKL